MTYSVRRLLFIGPLLLVVSAVAFGVIRLAPGGPFDRERVPASPEIEQAVRARYHLDDPLAKQYLRYLGLLWEFDAQGNLRHAGPGLIQGDLGPSLKYRNHSVNDIVAQALPVSALLGLLAFGVAIGLGIPLGLFSAARRRSWLGQLANLAALLAVCTPALVLGPLLILVLALRLNWFPPGLWESPRHMVLPAFTLGLYFAGRVARLTREGLLEVMHSDMFTAARAKGLSETALVLRHGLRLALLPVLAYGGPLLADLLTGSFVVENLFQIPGIGVFMVNSTLSRDYSMVIGLAVVYAALLLLLNLATDLLQRGFDPRIRHA